MANPPTSGRTRTRRDLVLEDYRGHLAQIALAGVAVLHPEWQDPVAGGNPQAEAVLCGDVVGGPAGGHPQALGRGFSGPTSAAGMR